VSLWIVVFTVVACNGCGNHSASEADLKELTSDWTQEQKADFEKLMKNTNARGRAMLIQEMLRERKEGLTIETLLVKWRPNGKELSGSIGVSGDVPGLSLLPLDIQILRGFQMNGSLEVVQGGVDGSAPKRVRVVIVMQHQIDRPFKFAIPNDGTVYCVQLESGLRMFPANYSKSQKTMELIRSSDVVTSLVKDDAGSVSSTTGFNWE
jgi:hypothetical protein